MAQTFMIEFTETICSGRIPKGLRLMITLDGGQSRPDSYTVEKALFNQLGIKLNGCGIAGKYIVIS
jgi:hypothetical protein